MRANLTERQRKVLGFIKDYLNDYGYPPTQEEIARALGIEWTRAVEKHLQALEKKEYIERSKGARTIRILRKISKGSLP